MIKTSFTNTLYAHRNGTSINDMKDMLASLPQLREAKDQVQSDSSLKAFSR